MAVNGILVIITISVAKWGVVSKLSLSNVRVYQVLVSTQYLSCNLKQTNLYDVKHCWLLTHTNNLNIGYSGYLAFEFCNSQSHILRLLQIWQIHGLTFPLLNLPLTNA